MNRKNARENAFILIFEKIFRDDSVEDIIKDAIEARNFEYDDYGLVELAAILAIHMFRHLIVKEQSVWGLSDMKNHPGCWFDFESGLNLIEIFYDHVDDIEGIWRYEDDEDEDWE